MEALFLTYKIQRKPQISLFLINTRLDRRKTVNNTEEAHKA